MRTGPTFPDVLIADPRIIDNPTSDQDHHHTENLRELAYMGASVSA